MAAQDLKQDQLLRNCLRGNEIRRTEATRSVYGVAVMSHMFIESVSTRTLFERQGTPCSEQSKILVTATGFEPTIT